LPVGHGGVLTLAPGATESLSYFVTDVQSLRFVALGSGFELTLVDAAGRAMTRSAVNGFADIFMNSTADGTAQLSVRNTAATTQQVQYSFGWVGAHVRSDGFSGIGQPEISVTVSPNQDGTPVTASGNVSVVAADGSFQTLPVAAPSYRAQFDGLAPGRYMVRTDMTILGVRSVGTWTTTVAAAESTPPSVGVSTNPGAPAAGGWFAGSVDVTISASDAGSGQDRIYWAVDSVTLTETFGAEVSTRVEAEGTHQLRYQARDRQGNTSALATRQINIDRTHPNIALQGVADGDEFEQDERVAIEYACEDALSGIQSCAGDVGSGDFLDTATPGAHSFQVTAVDRAGNEVVLERSYTVLAPDTTDPAIEIDVPAVPASGWYLDEVTVRFSASDESGIRRIHYEYGTMQGTVSRDIEADTAEVTFDRTQLYHLSYWAEDMAGNRSEGEQLNLYVDSDAPWIDVSSPDEGELSILPNGHVSQHERIVIDFRCDDIGSGIANCDATTPDGELLPTGTPGTHELRIVATDVAGHRTERVVSYTVDAAAPNGNGGVVRPAPRPASTGAEGLAGSVALAVLLLGAGATLALRRRVRAR
jgi:hypothetical protein